MKRAEQIDNQPAAGMDLPAELERREARLQPLADAQARIEERARVRDAEERAEYDAKCAKREALRKEGKKPKGKDPEPPTAGPGDKDQIEPMLAEIKNLPEDLGEETGLLADTGYFSEKNVNHYDHLGVTPMIAMRRDHHNMPLAERFAEDAPCPDATDSVSQMAWRLKTKAGRALSSLVFIFSFALSYTLVLQGYKKALHFIKK